MELLVTNTFKISLIIIIYSIFLYRKNRRNDTTKNDNNKDMQVNHIDLFEIGNTFYKEKNYLSAISFYTDAINIRDFSCSYNNRACAYWHMNEFEKAEADFKKAELLKENEKTNEYTNGVWYKVNKKIKIAFNNSTETKCTKTNPVNRKSFIKKIAWLNIGKIKNHNGYIESSEDSTQSNSQHTYKRKKQFEQCITYMNKSFFIINLN